MLDTLTHQPTEEAQQFLLRQQHLRSALEQHVEPDSQFDWFSADHTVASRFASSVARFPDHLAVLDDAVSLTYRQLDLASNRAANTLLARLGPGPEIVGLLLSPDAYSLVAALGVLKVGKAFVGFDDKLPEARCEQILADTDCRAVVGDLPHAGLAQRLTAGRRMLFIRDELDSGPDHDPRVALDPGDTAILNYSSGTTGQPKGVIQTHHSVVAQAANFAALMGLNSRDRLFNAASLAWAGTFWHYFGPLFYGAALATVDVRRLHVAEVMDWLADRGVTIMPGRAYIRQILAMAGDRQFHAVRMVHLGGDTIYDSDVHASRRTFPAAIVSVGLGITEAGRTAEWLIDAETTLDERVLPVGLPTPGNTIRLLDDHGHDVAFGEAGEIAVQSRHLSKGYWKQPALTGARFIDSDAAPRIYLTGDLGRFRPDGALEHLGRTDFQIKIHGYQVPALEIEGLLLAQPGIREACVTKQFARNGHELLIAFVSLAPGSAVVLEELRAALVASLPTYMVPHHIVVLPELPKTPTSKIARGQMPAFEQVRPRLATPYAAAASPIEDRLVSIWEEILDMNPVGVNDPFMLLGGDSLRAAQIANRVLAAFNIEISFAELLQAATVADMAAVLRRHLLEQSAAAGLSAAQPLVPDTRGRERD